MTTNIDALVSDLIRPELKTLKPYESARRLFSMANAGEIDTVWLNANENPFVPDISINPALYNRYPDFQPEPLIGAYADYAGVNTNQVLSTRGADESIELLIRTFCRADGSDSIVICPPTYGMYAISAETHGAPIKKVPLTSDMQLDLPAVYQNLDNSNIVFVCSPNNPTGNIIKRADFIALLDECKNKCLVVADEAYIEFCPEATMVDLLANYPNLVITRTLSKAFGLAGLRCGFTLANPSVIDALKKVIAPYPVPAPVAQIATEALSATGLTWMTEQVAGLNKLRDGFIAHAQQWQLASHVYPSQTNFVLLKLNAKLDAAEVLNTFVAKGILLRNQSKQLMLENTLRVTIGNESQMTAVLNQFLQVEKTL